MSNVPNNNNIVERINQALIDFETERAATHDATREAIPEPNMLILSPSDVKDIRAMAYYPQGASKASGIKTFFALELIELKNRDDVFEALSSYSPIASNTQITFKALGFSCLGRSKSGYVVHKRKKNYLFSSPRQARAYLAKKQIK